MSIDCRNVKNGVFLAVELGEDDLAHGDTAIQHQAVVAPFQFEDLGLQRLRAQQLKGAGAQGCGAIVQGCCRLRFRLGNYRGRPSSMPTGWARTCECAP